MKLAVISDIHGNYDALFAVLKKAANEGVDHLLILGDIVGYYYHPDKIMELLSEWNADVVKGNHEKILDDLLMNPSMAETVRLKYGSGHQEAIDKLSNDQLQYFKDLPETKSVRFDGVSFLLSHGSPWSTTYYIYPDCEEEIILKCDSEAHDFVLVGHSHYAFGVQNRSSILINPGSVGQSRQSGGKACWCIINTCNRCFQFMETEYDIEKLVHEVSEKDSDVSYLTEVLKRK